MGAPLGSNQSPLAAAGKADSVVARGQKKVKKNLSAPRIFTKRGSVATNRPQPPFKKTLEKVKKKLVIASEIG